MSGNDWTKCPSTYEQLKKHDGRSYVWNALGPL